MFYKKLSQPLSDLKEIYYGVSDGKESTCNVGRPRYDPWVGKISWRREWQPTPLFLPGESHGQRSLKGHSPWGCEESAMTEQLTRIMIPVLLLRELPEII
ncbi:unnamed protein product [Rangifer tarandus platyrhynchus]|uniref:Uncharacterized protein n=1 Tax=Rangifer tarandus platyrhynchus TaxID=3082113 RepID=A0ABN8YWW7_RANTA|nr:unnamed protein product [Rangifer tarandus platyrhynchus]